jgi:hypothetical protein
MLVHSLLGFFFLVLQWTYILAETTGEEYEDSPGEMGFPYCTLRIVFCRIYQISHQSEWGRLLTVSNLL